MNCRTSRLVRRSLTACALLAGLTIVALAPSPTAAQGTPEQRAMCQGDAQRLCSQYIPDVEKIKSCMFRNYRHLSAGCRRVLRR